MACGILGFYLVTLYVWVKCLVMLIAGPKALQEWAKKEYNTDDLEVARKRCTQTVCLIPVLWIGVAVYIASMRYAFEHWPDLTIHLFIGSGIILSLIIILYCVRLLLGGPESLRTASFLGTNDPVEAKRQCVGSICILIGIWVFVLFVWLDSGL